MEDVYLDSSGRRYFDQPSREVALQMTNAIVPAMEMKFPTGLLGRENVYLRIPNTNWVATATAALSSTTTELPIIFKPAVAQDFIIPMEIVGTGKTIGRLEISANGVLVFQVFVGGVFTTFTIGVNYIFPPSTVWYPRAV